MSTFSITVKNSKTGETTKCMCIDDHFGHHIYGYLIKGEVLTYKQLEDAGWERVREGNE